jgi:RNA recognition motif-containing protein
MGEKLFVGNLPFAATDANLTEVFGQVGKVESARVVTDKFSGRSKGFGFVEMGTDAEAAEAITKFNGADWEGRQLNVAEAKEQGPREPGSGGGGGGRGGRGGGRGGDRGSREG